MALYAVISDIHANFEALKAVEKDALQIAHNLGESLKYICLGDVVDYGPQPNECVEWVTQKHKAGEIELIQGNHDADTAVEDISQFPNSIDRAWWLITLWTRQALLPEHKRFMRQWIMLKQPKLDKRLPMFTLLHASIRYNHQGKIAEAREASDNFEVLSTRYGLFGHTHYQGFFIGERNLEKRAQNHYRVRHFYAIPKNANTQKYFSNTGELFLRDSHRSWYGTPIQEQEIKKVADLATLPEYQTLINPGSVGQPRRPQAWHHIDEINNLPCDSRAAYLLLHINGTHSPRFAFRRQSYDTTKVVEMLTKVRWQNANASEYYNLLKGGDIYYTETDYCDEIDNEKTVKRLNRMTQSLIDDKLIRNFGVTL